MSSAKRKNNGSRKRLRYQDLVSTRPGSLARRGSTVRLLLAPVGKGERGGGNGKDGDGQRGGNQQGGNDN